MTIIVREHNVKSVFKIGRIIRNLVALLEKDHVHFWVVQEKMA